MSSAPLFVLLRVCLLDSTLPVFNMALYIRARFVISLCCFIQRSAHLLTLLVKSGGGGGDGLSLRFIIFLLHGLFSVFQ